MPVGVVEKLVGAVGLQFMEGLNLTIADHSHGFPVHGIKARIAGSVISSDSCINGFSIGVAIRDEIRAGGWGGPGKVVAVIDSNVSGLSGFGGNQNHSKCASRSVNSSGSRILQYRD